MISGKILYVGEDVLSRTRVLQSVGYIVARCACEEACIREALAATPVDAILFHCQPEPPSVFLVDICRALSDAPILLFSDYLAAVSFAEFDQVVQPLSPPQTWLPDLAALIASRRNTVPAKTVHSVPFTAVKKQNIR